MSNNHLRRLGDWKDELMRQVDEASHTLIEVDRRCQATGSHAYIIHMVVKLLKYVINRDYGSRLARIKAGDLSAVPGYDFGPPVGA
jgi:hypothetical protein